MDDIINREDADFINEAVKAGPDGGNFDIARKIITLATLLGKEVVSAETAATEADGALFSKSVEYQVGDGKMSVDEGAEAIVDRRASGFVAAVRSMVAEAVAEGCEFAGVAIGAYFGNPEIGGMVGRTIGQFLNEPVGKAAEKGAHAIVTYVQKAWEKTKDVASNLAVKAVDFMFS